MENLDLFVIISVGYNTNRFVYNFKLL